MAYDFSTLDDHDFELLARDMLNARFGMELQDFKAGRDQGIDLRYSTPANENAIVVQAKHWVKSGYAKLYREMEKEELKKIKKLSPYRYILVTSVSLAATEKDELVHLLSPFVTSANDIFGKEDINKYLSELPDIERKWYKLWLTSTNVLQQVLHNGILGTNDFVANKILHITRLYVLSPIYDVAFGLLTEHKYLLITGQPGVGKSTLAYYLTYHFLAKGYQLLYVDTDISQASTLLSNDPAAKQIVFFDDFLGENYLETLRPKTTESAFVLFLERIQASENKLLILTTRTTVYTNAKGKYEKLDRMKVDIARKEIVLENYTLLDKAKILHKHIYYTDLTEEYKRVFFDSKHYWEVIVHRNYNPRLIEFVTSKKHVPKGTPTEYWMFVQQNLDNPEEVWRYFYEHQLSVEERILLHVIFGQNYTASASDTKELFDYMLQYEVQYYSYRPGISPFQNASKRLLDGTIKKEVHLSNMRGRLNFINPSLADFLKHYFKNSEEERRKLLKGACAVEQFEHFRQNFIETDFLMPRTEQPEAIWFVQLVLERASSLITYQELKREKSRENYIRLRIAALLWWCETKNDKIDGRKEQFVLDAVKQYPIENINVDSREYFVHAIQNADYESELYAYVQDKWSQIITALFTACVRESDFEEVKELFSEFEQSFETFMKDEANAEMLADALQELANNKTMDWADDEKQRVETISAWNHAKERIAEKRAEFFAQYNLNDDWYDCDEYFDDDDRDDIITENMERRVRDQMSPANLQEADAVPEEEVVQKIEILFNGDYDEAFVRKKTGELALPF